MDITDKFILSPNFTSSCEGEFTHNVYLVFRKSMKSTKTMRFHNSSNDQVLVDCGADGYPVAVQFISAEGMPSSEFSKSSVAGSKSRDHFGYVLFMLATEMIRYREANLQEKGNDLVDDVISAMLLF